MILFKIFFAPINKNRFTTNVTAEDVCVTVVKIKKTTNGFDKNVIYMLKL
jgi:transcriptional regulator NrdR family protein